MGKDGKESVGGRWRNGEEATRGYPPVDSQGWQVWVQWREKGVWTLASLARTPADSPEISVTVLTH